MNKSELINRVQRHMGAGTTRNMAKAAVDAVLDSILQEAETGPVHIHQLGTFEYQRHEERSAYDIFAACAGAPCSTLRLTFRPARKLKERTATTCHALPENESAEADSPGDSQK